MAHFYISIHKLIVARMDDDADRCMDGQGDRVRDTVVHVDEFHPESTGPDRAARFDGTAFGVGHAVFLQPARQDAQCQRCAVYGAVDFLHYIRQRTDVVFVSVRKEDPLDHIFIFLEIGKIRNHQVDPQHIIIWKSKTGIDEDDFVPVFEGGHILADFPQSAQRDDIQFLLCSLSFIQKGTSF